jgi:hypothetical protein
MGSKSRDEERLRVKRRVKRRGKEVAWRGFSSWRNWEY